MTKRQIARKLVDTEARIKLLKSQLEKALQKAKDLEEELERPAAAVVKVLKPNVEKYLERKAS